MTAARTDDPWLTRFRTEGTAALAAFHAEHYLRLERLVRFRMTPILTARVDPADVLQEAYLEAQRRLPEYLADPRLPPFVWLRQITVQELLVAYRRHVAAGKRSLAREVALAAASPAVGDEFLFDNGPTPEQAAVLAEVGRRVRALVDNLDDIDRQVLTLRHFEGLSNDETAAALDLKKSAASNRYVRALARFRALFDPAEELTVVGD